MSYGPSGKERVQIRTAEASGEARAGLDAGGRGAHGGAMGWAGRQGHGYVVLQFFVIFGYASLPLRPWPGADAGWVRAPLLLGGTALALAGVALTFAALHRLGWRITALPHPQPQTRLVDDGPFRRLRHPIYGGLLWAALGWALLHRSWPHLLGCVGVALFFHAKAAFEEARMRERFPDYAAFAATRGRFLPRWRRPSAPGDGE